MIRSQHIAGNIYRSPEQFEGLQIDFLALEWFDVDKGILRMYTVGGQEIGYRNLSAQSLRDGDVLYFDSTQCIAVRILPCLCLVVYPRNIWEMANVCSEIGNRHLPISIHSSSEVMVAFESPLQQLFAKYKYHLSVEERVLQQTQTLRIHEWTSKTKFKITLAHKINESFVDPVADQ